MTTSRDARDDDLEQAIGRYLEAREDAPGLLPGAFAATLPEALRSAFLRELEALAELDQLASLAPPRDLPLRFGDFRVLGQLGQGAMGAVYLAEQVSLGRRIALKVLHAQVAGDVRSAARFQREARTAASLVHPCIVPILGFGEQQGYAWLAMGLVEGRSLQRLLAAYAVPADVDHGRARALLSAPKKLALALADAADALDFAHKKNVVHRDVKPGNLMVQDDGKVTVLDFGLATARPGDDTADSLTRTGDFLGTPVYMAPEQTAGAEAATALSDVYSIGAVLYECLCGRPPVAPGPLPEVLDAIRHRDPVDPRRWRDGVPAELARVALQCLEKNPQRRYASAALLADDLRRFVDGKPVRARGVGPLRRFARRVQRRPAVAAAALLLIVAAVFGASALQNAAAKHTVENKNAVLEKEKELREIRQQLALSPEGITVFGGASRKWYSLLGLGDHLPPAETAVSPAAQEALRRADALAAAWPQDNEVQFARCLAYVDVGIDEARFVKAAAALAATPRDDTPGRSVSWMQYATGIGAGVDILPPGMGRHDPFWAGMAHQALQNYALAIEDFDEALVDRSLPEELRYFAFLHRGWCKTCPEISRLREAEDDLLAAATLRPNYGTARLLWAGLRCLDPSEDLARPVTAVTEVLTAVKMEPWVVVLTARVLLAIAEDSTFQAGPVHFGAELSPLATQPVSEERRQALAGKALELLDAVAMSRPGLQEPKIHRTAALTLLGRHDEALAQCDALPQAPLAELLRARVLLASGRTQRAAAALARALALDADFVAAWRCKADLYAHVGDRKSELAALERAAALLLALQQSMSVFPEAALALPSLQLRRARVLIDLGRTKDALDLLDDFHNFGMSNAGADGPRAAAERDALRARASTGTPTDVATALLGEPTKLQPSAFAAAARRGWLVPTLADLQQLADRPGWRDAALQLAPLAAPGADAAGLAEWIAATAPPDPPSLEPWAALAQKLFFEVQRKAPRAPGTAALHDVRRLADKAIASPEQLAQLLAFAEQQGADQDNSDARLLKAAVLLAQGRPADAAEYLAATLAAHAVDLRGRFLQACAALAANREALAKSAVTATGQAALERADVDYLRAAIGAPIATDVIERLAALL